MATGIFHAGELQAQQMAGVREKMARVGGALIRDHMPEQHREFFPLLPTLMLGGHGARGRVWASVLWGAPGFVQSPDPVTLRIGARLAREDPLRLHAGMQLGTLGLQFETRRRNRANGVITALDEGGCTLNVTQSFGNCPKYIQAREAVLPPPQAPGQVHGGEGEMPAPARALIAAADTFFIASAVADGADVSHRGGRPGFVRVAADGALCWPDYQGNNFFNTVGNLLADARAGLLFIDFERGDLLQLSGRAAPEMRQGQRMLRFVAQEWLWRPAVMPLRWRLREVSPYLEGTPQAQ